MWKTWSNANGGLTTRIREHMRKKHGDEFHTKCQEEGIFPPGDILDDLDDEISDSEFTPELFAERLAQWIAVDDQVRRFSVN